MFRNKRFKAYRIKSIDTYLLEIQIKSTDQKKIIDFEAHCFISINKWINNKEIEYIQKAFPYRFVFMIILHPNKYWIWRISALVYLKHQIGECKHDSERSATR